MFRVLYNMFRVLYNMFRVLYNMFRVLYNMFRVLYRNWAEMFTQEADHVVLLSLKGVGGSFPQIFFAFYSL